MIWENWTSPGGGANVGYTGKSYNAYTTALKRWEQFWVDNRGSLTHYFGELKECVMDFQTDDFPQLNGDETTAASAVFTAGAGSGAAVQPGIR